MTAIKLVIFGLVLVAVLVILASLPHIDISTGEITTSAAWSWIVAAMYFIPTHTVVTILGVVVVVGVWSLIVSVVKTLWDLLPVGK